MVLTKPVVAEQAGLQGYESSQPAESLSANPCKVYELNHHLTLLLPGTLYLVHCPYITSHTSPRDDLLPYVFDGCDSRAYRMQSCIAARSRLQHTFIPFSSAPCAALQRQGSDRARDPHAS